MNFKTRIEFENLLEHGNAKTVARMMFDYIYNHYTNLNADGSDFEENEGYELLVDKLSDVEYRLSDTKDRIKDAMDHPDHYYEPKEVIDEALEEQNELKPIFINLTMIKEEYDDYVQAFIDNWNEVDNDE